MNQAPIVNPTREQQLTLKGIIYGIRHKESGMFYIGQTIDTFRKRYKGGKWWKKRKCSAYLCNMASKYGPEAFEIWILEHSIGCRKRLDELEEHHAKERNTYKPFGFNLMPCGFTGKARAQQTYASAVAKMNAKSWQIKELATGAIHYITNLSAFCRGRGLEIGNLHRMLTISGRGAVSQGFTLPETTEDDITNLGCYRNGNVPYGPYKLWKEGMMYEFGDIKAFAGYNRGAVQALCRLLRGDVPYWRGFTLQNTPPLRHGQIYTDIRFLDPQGKERVFVDVYDAQMCLGATEGHLRELIQGKGQSCKGYKFVSVRRLKGGCQSLSEAPASES